MIHQQQVIDHALIICIVPIGQHIICGTILIAILQYTLTEGDDDDEGSDITPTRWVLWDNDRVFIDRYHYYRVLISLSLYSITSKLYTNWVLMMTMTTPMKRRRH